MNNNLEIILLTEGISQTQLAQEANLSYTTVNHVYTKRKEVSDRSKFRVLKALNKLSDKEYQYEQVFGKRIDKNG